MDLLKIGAFIAEKRKAKNLTQKELATMLHLSEKTISKWECGKGFPEASSILPLCKILEISANELLSGKSLESHEVDRHAEENIINLLYSKNDYNLKKWSIIFIAILSLSIIIFASMIREYILLPVWVKVILIVLLFLLFFASIISLCALSNSMGTFTCKHCNHKFTPKLSAFFIGVHTWNKRYLKCPRCQKKSFCQFESYKKQNKLK